MLRETLVISFLTVEIFFFFFNDTATTEIYTLSLHDALPIYLPALAAGCRSPAAWPGTPGTGSSRSRSRVPGLPDRKSTRLNSSHQIISYAVFCLKKKNKNTKKYNKGNPHQTLQ